MSDQNEPTLQFVLRAEADEAEQEGYHFWSGTMRTAAECIDSLARSEQLAAVRAAHFEAASVRLVEALRGLHRCDEYCERYGCDWDHLASAGGEKGGADD